MRKIKNPNKVIINGDISEIWITSKNEEYCCIVDTEDVSKITHLDLDKDKYARIYVKGKHIKLHRYLLDLNKNEGIVDHIDRNRLNNTKRNLRIVSAKDNSRNRSSITMSVKGVFLRTRKYQHPHYVARIVNNESKEISKSFSTRKHSNAFELAIQQRLAWEKEFGYMPA
jgi:hypothetical protein